MYYHTTLIPRLVSYFLFVGDGGPCVCTLINILYIAFVLIAVAPVGEFFSWDNEMGIDNRRRSSIGMGGMGSEASRGVLYFSYFIIHFVLFVGAGTGVYFMCKDGMMDAPFPFGIYYVQCFSRPQLLCKALI